MVYLLAKLLPYYLALALQITTSLAQRGSDNAVSPMTPSNKVHTRIPIRDQIYGDRDVSYFTTDDGLAIIDGDIIYGTVDQLRAKDVRGNPGNSTSLENRAFSLFSSGSIWPGGNLRYKYDSAATQTLLSATVNAAIARWTSGAPWLTFTQVANSDVGENGVVMIRAPVCGGCNANLGWTNAPMTMNLQQSCPSSPGTCGVKEATHEFGHLLGFFHEHQRPTRETTVHYNCANLNPFCGASMPAGKTCCDSGLPSGCCSASGNFALITSSSFDASGSYDVSSIMQYRSNSFALPGTDTLTPAAGTSGVVIPTTNPSNPSGRDFNRLCKMYKTVCPAALTCAANGCPASCTIINVCNKLLLCNSVLAPLCCDPFDANEACQAKKDTCTSLGCDFLTQ